MSRYRVHVFVEAESKEQVSKVMDERIYFDEDYGFPYTIDYDYIERVGESDETLES